MPAAVNFKQMSFKAVSNAVVSRLNMAISHEAENSRQMERATTINAVSLDKNARSWIGLNKGHNYNNKDLSRLR